MVEMHYFCSMKKGLLFTLILLFLFAACRHSDTRLQYADALSEQNETDSAESILAGIEQPEKLSKSDNALYALMTAEKARREGKGGMEADSLLSVALEYYRNTTDSLHLLRVMYTYGRLAFIFHRNEEAMKYLLEALHYSNARAVSDDWRYAVNTWAGVVAAKERLFEDKIHYSQKALKLAKKMKNSSYECTSLGDVAYGHLFKGRYDSALHYTKVMHEVALRDSLFDKLPYIYTRFLGIYIQQEKYELALEYVNEALSLRKDSVNIWGHYSEKSLIFGKLGQFDSAYYYFLKSAPCPDPYTQEARYYNIADAYHSAGRFKDAYLSLLHYTEIDDSIKEKAKSTELIAMQNLYQHERLQSDNLRWRTKAAEQQQQVYWFAAMAFALLWVAGIIYFVFYRRNRRRLISQQRQLIGQQQQIITQQKELQLRNEERIENIRQIAELREKEDELKSAFFRQLNQRILRQAEETSKGGNIILSDKDWEVIVENADAIFNRFTLRLQREYPNLNKDDIRYCCMVKMQLSQLEIAQIMHLEKDSVKKRLKRIRTDKMGAGSGMTLEDFLRNF